MKPLRLPWGGRDVPSAILDVIRGCNCRCKACFNRREARVKPLAEIHRELKVIQANRDVQSVAISGGEPLLHPQIEDIVRLIRSAGLEVAMLTNGVLWTEAVAKRLADAGLGFVMFHLQPDQCRPDFSAGSPECFALLREKCACAVAHGLEALAIATVNRRDPESVREHLRAFLCNRHCSHLWLTLEREMQTIDAGVEQAAAGNGVEEMSELLVGEGWRPFAGLGGRREARKWRWMTYHAFVRIDRTGRIAGMAAVPPSLFEKALFALIRRLRLRLPYHVRSSRTTVVARLLLNALTGGPVGNVAFALSALLRGQRIVPKHVIVEALPELTANGEVEFCDPCIDATVAHGRLVPPCLIDTDFVRKGVACE